MEAGAGADERQVLVIPCKPVNVARDPGVVTMRLFSGVDPSLRECAEAQGGHLRENALKHVIDKIADAD
ncbi:MAG: hypothetical protein QXJ26_05355 [Desulfurococcaceae archaeon]